MRFKAGNLDVIVLSYQYNTAPNADVLAWGRRVFESHPRALGVVASHSIVSGGGGFSAQGRAIYDSLRDVDNVQLMASGHVSVDARRTDTFQGNVIHSMLSDFQRCFPDESDPNKPLVGEQSRTNGGDGYMRIWRFSPKEQKLHVRTFSPKRNAAYTDPRNHFSVNVDLVGAGTGDAIELGAVTAENGTASLPLPLLDDAYEWFAVVDTCNHETTSTLQLVTR